MKKAPTVSLSKYLLAGTSLALGLGFGLASAAAAQEDSAKKTQNTTATADDTGSIETVIVVGSRASQQSSIDRKKKATTATDSIVADDVGSFPDRNINEAISRIAGMGIDRDDTGEGQGLTLRGNSADLTRVEMDGMSVASGGYSLATNEDSAGRGADLRELPADLIESVDVIKGNTPDMTEGGLGGTVKITTRSSLSLKKPYFSMRVGMDSNSISDKWSPDISLVGSRKFLDGRLGVIFNLSSKKVLNDSRQYTSSGASSNRGYILTTDYEADGAPKTFTWNPSALSGPAADAIPYYSTTYPTASWALSNGSTFDAYTPRKLMELSAAAQTKTQCTTGSLATLTNAGLTTMGMTSSAARTAAIAQRVREQQTCLNQWNDYLPEQVRLMNVTKYEDRRSGDIRFDYRVNDHLSLYAKYMVNSRDLHNVQRQYSYNNMAGTGVVINPSSVVVDANHFVTKLSYTGGTLGHDNLFHEEDWNNQYLLTGGNYKNGPLKIDFILSRSETEFTRTYKRMSRGFAFDGAASMELTSDGVWKITPPAGFNEKDLSQTLRLTAANAASPLLRTVALQFQGQQVESGEDQAKIDAVYRIDKLPFLTQFKAGASRRILHTNRWLGASSTPIAGVTVPGSGSTSAGNLRICQNQSTTTAANACQYGLVWNTGTSARFGNDTITPARWLEIMAASNEPHSGAFMPGISAFDGIELWDSINVEKAFAMTNATLNYNLDCIKVCTGSDGKSYPMNYNQSDETITAAYYMFDFEQNLPLDMSLSGNFGVRMVNSSVEGQGFMTLNYTYKNANWNATTNNNAVTTTVVQKPVSIERSYTDWLPSYNLALWAVPDKVVLRYNWSKTVARPDVTKIWPAGTCTYDERIADAQDAYDGDDEDGTVSLMGCSSTLGNADLKPYTATKNNTSLEWYINKDTFVSLAYYRQKIRIGSPQQYQTTGSPFGGSSEIDPNTGRPLSDYSFTYNTWRNRPGDTQSGWELSTKTALTFLPWHLRYTGVDFNVSTNESRFGSYVDNITGENLGNPGRSNYFANLAVWYDDGKTNARLSYQMRDAVLRRVAAPNGAYPVPTLYNTQDVESYRGPYTPFDPLYTDEYRYLDGKISHNLSKNVQIYLEGRNLLNYTRIITGSENRGPANSDYIIDQQFGGRRITFGVIIKQQ
ncbi:TonB-dependent receptor [Asticcacaulis sp. BYS171W]|uniref:TonB-dependent receptor n=1 Tax=Asticcacaulis aquaticus TaxID=2984212 RepID=A0ABT5HYY1_9CAUL|nr:TonB-dependent receptor [Asticcacaulis aquaticus]MDC7685287.1 TonB-dependent receptor [Asticcacaulis aquaticus]